VSLIPPPYYAEDEIILLLYNTLGVSIGVRKKCVLLTDTNKTETLSS